MENFIEENEPISPCNINCSFCFLNYTDVLEKNYLFRNLDSQKIGEILKNTHHQTRTFQKGDFIAFSGDHCTNLMIIVKGAAVGEMPDFRGKTLRIGRMKAPESIASAFVFGENNKFPVDVIAVEDTKLLIIPKQDLMNLLRLNETVLGNYLYIISNQTQHLSQKVKLLGLQTITGKIAHYLLDLVNRNKNMEVKLKHTQRELSSMFGVSRPALARVIRQLHKDAVIQASGKHIKILDKNALSDFLY